MLRSCLDKDLKLEGEPCGDLGEENLRQKQEPVQRSRGESVLRVFQT